MPRRSVLRDDIIGQPRLGARNNSPKLFIKGGGNEKTISIVVIIDRRRPVHLRVHFQRRATD